MAKLNENIVILDSKEVPILALKRLSKIGNLIKLNLNHLSKREDLRYYLDKATILWIALGQKIDEDLIKSSKFITDVVSITTGSNHVDLEYLNSRGIKFYNLRNEKKFLKELSATSEHTWALLLALRRKLYHAYQDVTQGNWRREKFRGNELASNTLGILGVGRLGRKVASYGRAFGMNIIAYEINPKKIPKYIKLVSSLKDLIKQSDIISIHIHISNENYKIFSKELLSHLKPNAIIINTARGELIDEVELVNILKNKKIGGYAGDVVENELNIEKSPLQQYALQCPDNLILTPHIGGFTKESRTKAEIFMAEKFVQHKLRENLKNKK